MLDVSKRLLYYKRRDIQEALVHYAEDKEIAVSYGGTGYGKRPDTIQYPADVLESVKKGVTSFHCSEELWINPLQITTGMKKHEVHELRKGWDLILDIDCDVWRYSQLAADLLVKALQHYGINAISVKFSGNHGFHIGVPFESFPPFVHGEPTQNLFPEGPRKIASKLSDMIKVHLAKAMLAEEGGDVNKVAARIGKPVSELMEGKVFDPYKVLTLDTVLISSRHLYRMPYSFNEKSGWVSVPIALDNILTFDREKQADSTTVEVNEHIFLDKTKITPGEGSKLIIQAFDFVEKLEEVELEKRKKQWEAPVFALQEELFPPCIKKMLQPMEDGKKRAMFIMTNFMASVGWNPGMIEERLREWNETNEDPIRETILKGHMDYHARRKDTVLPPNCNNAAYYKDLQMCVPDGLCNARGPCSIKNPVNYSMYKMRRLARDKQAAEREQAEKEAHKEALKREDEREKAKMQGTTIDSESNSSPTGDDKPEL